MSVDDDPTRLPCPRAAGCLASQTAPRVESPPTRATWTHVGAERDVPASGMKAFSADGVTVLVIRVGADLAAVQPFCPHEAIPLERGIVEGPTLTCLEHMWQFDVKSGAPLGEATDGLRTYSIRSDAGELYVALE